MKKALVLFTAFIILISLVACGGITHCKDCDDEIYKDGYCQYHYTVHQAKDAISSAKEAIDSAAKGAFDKIIGN